MDSIYKSPDCLDKTLLNRIEQDFFYWKSSSD